MAIDEESGNLRRARRLTAILLTRFALSGWRSFRHMRENQSFGELPKPKELRLCAARRFAGRKSKWGAPSLGSQAPTYTTAMEFLGC
jgi:hypothetical protein